MRDERGARWVVAQWALIAGVLLAPQGGPRPSPAVARGARLLGVPLLAAGAALMARGLADLGPNVTPLPEPKDDSVLVQTGLYARVRHPIYTAFDLLALGWAFATANPRRLALAAALTLFFDAKANREEAGLAARFPGYPAYRARVAKCLPGVY